MMKRLSILFTAIFALTAFVFVGGTAVRADIAIGGTIENFMLNDTSGKSRSFDDLKGKSGTVIVFVSAQCPVVKGYNERISRLAADYQAKGISFVGINSNSTESLEWAKSHAEENYKFPVLIDKGNAVADRLGANVTPEMFYFNGKNVLVYHGAIDNDKSGENVTANYLRDAIDSTLAGKTVAKTTAFAIGCSIKRASKN
jgi:peroxiredoxin